MLEQINFPGQPKLAVLFDACVSKPKLCHGGCSQGDGLFCRHKFRDTIITLVLTGKKENRLQDLNVIWLFFEWIFRTSMFNDRRRPGQYVIITKDKDFIEDAKDLYDRLVKRGRLMNKPRLEFYPDQNCIVSGEAEIWVVLLNCLPYGVNSGKDMRCIINHVDKMSGYINNNIVT